MRVYLSTISTALSFHILAESTNGVSQTQVPVSEEPVIQVEQAEQPQMYHVGIQADKIEEPVSQVKQAEQPLMYQFDDQSEVDSGTPPDASVEVHVDEVSGTAVEEPVSHVEQVEQPLVYQFDQSDPTGASQVVEEPANQVQQAEQQPVMYNFDIKTDAKPPLPPSKVTTPPKKEEPRCQPVKEEEPVTIVKKDPGWYKQMFQKFQNTVEESSPGGQQHVKI